MHDMRRGLYRHVSGQLCFVTGAAVYAGMSDDVDSLLVLYLAVNNDALWRQDITRAIAYTEWRAPMIWGDNRTRPQFVPESKDARRASMKNFKDKKGVRRAGRKTKMAQSKDNRRRGNGRDDLGLESGTVDASPTGECLRFEREAGAVFNFTDFLQRS